MMALVACTGPASTPAPGSGAGRSPTVTTEWSTERRVAESAALLEPLSAAQPGCSAAVGVDGSVVWTGARGMAELANGTALTPLTVFDIGSVSKQFTATAVLLLAQEGRLVLDDTIDAHLAGLPPWAGRITIAQLIHHTSGIPEIVELLADRGVELTEPATTEQAMRVLAETTELDFEPGTSNGYSNSNYLLLAAIVGTVTGQPLPQFLATYVFTPLGLNMIMDDGRAPIPGKAVSYDRTGDGQFPVIDYLWPTAGPGGIHTTPSELVRWADNYRTGRLGGPELLNAQLGEPAPIGTTGDQYAAGIIIDNDGTLRHDGRSEGFFTEFGISADRHTAVAVACNAHIPRSMTNALLDIWT